MTDPPATIGNRLAPARFIAFLVVLAVAAPAGVALLGVRLGAMIGFDVAALAFIGSIVPLLDDETRQMRDSARRNDANRALLLGITGAVMIVVLVAVAAELSQKGAARPFDIVVIVATLSLAWTFSNIVYALHYAHLYYAQDGGEDRRGINFPGDDDPDYWDFIYFSATLGMTFQTSDVEIADRDIRRVATFHALAAFVFNLGIVAFTVNVLGGS